MSDVGGASRLYEAEGTHAINASACCAKLEDGPQLLSEDQSITRCGEIFRSETALIKRLQYDILRYIFELCCEYSLPVGLPLVGACFPNRRNVAAAPQVTLSHVCSSWRDIVLRIPTFWNSVKIRPVYFHTPQRFDFEFVLKLTNEWLYRAKGLPCSINIVFPWDFNLLIRRGWTNYWNEDWQMRIVRDLLSSHKVKKLCVAFADHHIQDFLRLADEQLACIEDLSITYINLNEDEIANAASPFDLHKLPNLTSFELSDRQINFESPGNSFGRYARFASVPCYNLRDIRLYSAIPATFCLDVLERGSFLETCFLTITGDHTVTQRAPVHLFQLQKLEVDVRSPSRRAEILETFLSSLRLPRLKSLMLGSYIFPTTSIDTPMLLRVQKATRIHLEELIIRRSTVTIDVQSLLIGFPSLKHLELPEKVIFSSDTMNEVGAGSIGVFLEHLIIYDDNLDLEKLLQMVKVRSHPGKRGGKDGIEVARFKTVYLFCGEERIQYEVRVLMDEIRDLGVGLELSFC